jgi:hypothetical protein
VLRRQLTAATEALAGDRISDRSVHQARKHIKKARAVLRLVERATDTKDARHCLRHAGRLLSRLRDAAVLSESAAQLCSSGRQALSQKTCLALRNRLQQRRMRVRGSVERHHAIEHARTVLERVRGSVDTWRWKAVGTRELSRATRRIYKRARRAMAAAEGAGDATRFHEWRKSVKLLWYALRLQELTVPAARGQAVRLARIGTWLGDDHNLAVLESTVSRDPSLSHGRDQISGLVRRRQKQLRQMLLKRGAAFFSDTPKAFAKGLQRPEQPVAARRQRGPRSAVKAAHSAAA